jgi:hypothetical protein
MTAAHTAGHQLHPGCPPSCFCQLVCPPAPPLLRQHSRLHSPAPAFTACAEHLRGIYGADTLVSHHHVMWMGDLNYRLDWKAQVGPLEACMRATVSLSVSLIPLLCPHGSCFASLLLVLVGHVHMQQL